MTDVLIVGGTTGQLGRTFKDLFLASEGLTFSIAPRAPFHELEQLVRKSRADIVLNCAAWNNVPGAEHHYSDALRLNAELPGILARTCRETGKKFVTYSTDYVFHGVKGAYVETDLATPKNAYGWTKLAGERRVTKANPEALILRTAGPYSPYGSNFILKILDLVNKGQTVPVSDALTMNICDTVTLARSTFAALAKGLSGVYHCVNSDSLSWYDVAKYVATCAGAPELVTRGPLLDDVPRPMNSTLDCAKLIRATGVSSPHWRTAVRTLVENFTP